MHNKPFEPTPGMTHCFLWSRGGAAQRQRWAAKRTISASLVGKYRNSINKEEYQ
jgi:hypothetical protein